MSGTFASRLPFRNLFNGAAAAGPHRILVIGGIVAAVIALLVAATFYQSTPPVTSQVGRLPRLNTLPGGVNSTAYQDALAARSNQDEANKALVRGDSYTPQMSSGQSVADNPPNPPVLTRPTPPAVVPVTPPRPAPAPVAPTVAAPAPAARVQPTREQTNENKRYEEAVSKILAGWGARPPQTDIILQPEDISPPDRAAPPAPPPSGFARSGAEATPIAATMAARAPGRSDQGRVLIPAGRGVFGRTVLAASSKSPTSEVVLEADTGPIQGARLIGAFSTEDDRLVVRGNRVMYQGRELSAPWIVVSPSTMETGVASNVDQEYLARFILPGAAAFIQGLGQAFASSNSAITQSPFGSVTALQRLNLGQQLGIGAGVAAGRIGQELERSAPKGPTVTLERQSSVGIMFLANLTAD